MEKKVQFKSNKSNIKEYMDKNLIRTLEIKIFGKYNKCECNLFFQKVYENYHSRNLVGNR